MKFKRFKHRLQRVNQETNALSEMSQIMSSKMKTYRNRLSTLSGWCGDCVEKQKTFPFIVVTIRSRSSPPSTLSAKTIVYLPVKVQQSTDFTEVRYIIPNNDIKHLAKQRRYGIRGLSNVNNISTAT